jgi:hypothetical protein
VKIQVGYSSGAPTEEMTVRGWKVQESGALRLAFMDGTIAFLSPHHWALVREVKEAP